MDTSDEEVDLTSNSYSSNGFNVVYSQDLDEADLDAIKGDIIGDTVYSSKWILETLISLSKVCEEEWSQQTLEKDLCMLWDMTAEKDVVIFLKDNHFLQIAEFTLKKSTEPRLTEIIIGIVANMCCQPTILEAIGNTDNLVSIIFQLLTTDDTETLIQILRLLQCSVWYINKNPETKWLRHLKDCKYLGDGLSFILQSSTNDDLLIAAVDLLQSISIVGMPDQSCLLTDLINVDKLLPAMVECFAQLIPKNDVTYSRVDLKFIENWLTILSNIMQTKLEIFSSQTCNDIIEKIIQSLYKILQPYVQTGNLFPLDEKLALCIHDCVEMIIWFQRNEKLVDSKVICVIVTIMQELRSAIKVDTEMDRIMDMDEAKELAIYLEKYWLETLRAYDDNRLLEIIRLCDKDVIQCLMDVAKEYSKEFPDTIVILSRVESLCLDR